MKAEQFWEQWQRSENITHHTIDDWPIRLLEAYAAAQLAEKERDHVTHVTRLLGEIESLQISFGRAAARAEAAKQRLQEAQAFVCASLGIDHDEEAGYTIIAEPEPIEAGDTFEEAIGEFVKFNNKCDDDLRERLRQREVELEQLRAPKIIGIDLASGPDKQVVLLYVLRNFTHAMQALRCWGAPVPAEGGEVMEIVGKSFWIRFYQEWTQLLHPSAWKWLDFTFITAQIEYDRMTGTIEPCVCLLGFGVRASISVSEPSPELIAAIDETVASIERGERSMS